MTSEEILREDVASVERVRNRLSKSADNQLSKILAALLPKLMARLESSLLGPFESPNCEELTLLVQEHINGILCHSLERLRANQSLETYVLMQGLLPFLRSDSTVVSTWALIFLQRGISRCTSTTLPSDMASTLIQSVDLLHSEATVNPCKTVHARLNSSSWLFLDCVMMSAGLKSFIDWDLDLYEQKDLLWEIENSSKWIPLASENAASAAVLDGSGVFHLLLDLLLFWPTELAARTGVSVEGETRLCLRSQIPDEERRFLRVQPRGARNKWSDIAQSYLRHLKLVGLRYTIWPRDGGLFQGENSDRALVLAVLFASQDSMHGRLAAEYIHKFNAVTTATRGAFTKSTAQYSVHVACALLILMAGDVRVIPLLTLFEKIHRRAPWKKILGEIATQETRQRPPLPASLSFRATSFLLDHRPSINDVESGREEIQLLVDLALLLATRPEGDGSMRIADESKYSKFGAVQLMQVFFDQLIPCSKVDVGRTNDPLAISVIKACLDVAVEVISIVVELGNANLELYQVGNQLLPGGVEAPFQHRHDLNRMLNSHRATQKRRNLGTDDAERARQVAYNLIARCACHTIRREKRPFELPIILFRCSIYEDAYMQHYVRKASSALLDLYTCIIHNEKWEKLSANAVVGETTISLQQLVVPLLPAILDAVCSDSVDAIDGDRVDPTIFTPNAQQRVYLSAKILDKRPQ